MTSSLLKTTIIALIFTLLPTYSANAGLFDFMSGGEPAEQNYQAASLNPSSGSVDMLTVRSLLDWHVSPIIPEQNRQNGYCAMATKYDGDIVLTHTRNNLGLGTISFDIPSILVEPNNSYLITLTIGNTTKRVYAARAVKNTTLIARTGNDPVLFDALVSGQNIAFDLDNGLIIQNLAGNKKAFFEFEYCLSGLEHPKAPEPVVVQVPVIEKQPQKIVQSPRPLPRDVAEQLDDNIHRLEQPVQAQARTPVDTIDWETSQAATISDDLITTTHAQAVPLNQKAYEDSALAVASVSGDQDIVQSITPYNINDSNADVVLGSINDQTGIDMLEPIAQQTKRQTTRIDEVPLSSVLSIAGLRDIDVKANPEQKGLVSWTEKKNNGLNGSVQHISIFHDVNLNDFIMADLDTIERNCNGQFSTEIGVPETFGNQQFARVELICNTRKQTYLSALIYQLSPDLLSIWSVDGHQNQRVAIVEDRNNIAEVLTQRSLLAQ